MNTQATDATLLKWGFSSLAAPEMDLRQLVELAARYGCPHLELRTLNGKLDLPAALKADFATSAEAIELLAAHGVRLVCLNSSFKLTDSGEADRAALADFARWADELGAPFIRVFGGGKWGEEPSAEQWACAKENVAWWQAEKLKNNWRADILLETHDAFSGTLKCLELFARIGQSLGIIWDTHHTWKLAEESPAETWSALKPYIRHVHVKDSVSQPSARHPYTYVLLGEGEMPWREALNLLIADQYEGVVSLEWEKLWHPYLAPLEDALRDGRQRGVW